MVSSVFSEIPIQQLIRVNFSSLKPMSKVRRHVNLEDLTDSLLSKLLVMSMFILRDVDQIL